MCNAPTDPEDYLPTMGKMSILIAISARDDDRACPKLEFFQKQSDRAFWVHPSPSLYVQVACIVRFNPYGPRVNTPVRVCHHTVFQRNDSFKVEHEVNHEWLEVREVGFMEHIIFNINPTAHEKVQPLRNRLDMRNMHWGMRYKSLK
ncbi:hypothetical protein N7453_010017 [Penicillium expansum]|nr:hypothetical protein N7453_010017 [Penicillium expansum]